MLRIVAYSWFALAPSLLFAFEERPQPLDPVTPRSEAAQQQIRAAALFATGRALFQRGEMEVALRYYQRASRWDPDTSTIAEDIVPLAFSLQRPNEAVRYALLSAERFESDPLLLRRLALYLTEEGDFQRAVRLYRKWLAHPETRLDRTRLDTLLVWLEIGRLEFIVENSAEASRILGEFQQAVLQSPPDSRVRRRLRRALGENLGTTWEMCALVHSDAKAFDLAAQALEQIELPPEKVGRLGYLKARAALARNQPQKAEEHLREYFDQKHTDEGTAPYRLLREVLTQLGRGESYIAEMQKLLAADPKNRAIAFVLAEEFTSQKQAERAGELFRSIVESLEPVSHDLLVDAFSQLIQLQTERDDAESLFATLQLASQQLGSFTDLEEALAAIPQQPGLVDRLTELADQQADATAQQSLAIAALLLSADRVEDADRLFQTALAAERDRTAELTLAWGLALIAADKHAEAADVFQKGIDDRRLDANDPAFHFYLSVALEMAGHTDEALRVARQAAAMRPDSAEFAARVPWILYHADRRVEATAAYGDFVHKFDNRRDDSSREELRDARFSLSNLAVLEGDVPAATEWLEQVLDEFPDDVGAMNDLGYLWVDNNMHLAHARRLIKQAVDARPESAAYRDSLGWALYRAGDHEGAIRELHAAVDLSLAETNADPKDPAAADGVILDHLGDAYLLGGQIDQARRWWSLALPQLEEQDAKQAAAIRQKIDQHVDGQASGGVSESAEVSAPAE